uniref:Uncharacterized protein n=1 Tax=Phlebotomus papatasi TaxID=29031 RepID=A0A1B0DGY2_PHLPP
MPFEQPMLWSEPINHEVDCYFCGTHVFGHSRKTKSQVKYPRVSSVTLPVPHKLGSPIPQPVEIDQTRENAHVDGGTTQGDVNITTNDADFDHEFADDSPHLVSQPELNDLARDLYLTKEGTEVLGSRLQQWNLLKSDTKTTFARRRNENIAKFFEMKKGFCLCRDPAAVIDMLSCPQNPEEWRLFIDSSKSSLKAVLLHNGNKLPSTPIVHAVGKKEDYKTLQILLNAIEYSKHNWKICGDFKVIGILMGMKSGYPKYFCFLCLWDSRDYANHFTRAEWGSREQYVAGSYSIENPPLVDPKKVLIPPMHIKLGLMASFVKGLNKSGKAFSHLRNTFSGLSKAKLEAGVFVGPQIRKLMPDNEFPKTMTAVELRAWKALCRVCNEFLGNFKSPDYKEIVDELVMSFYEMGCKIDGQGERFHQDILTTEKRYQGRWNPKMMAEYVWLLVRETKFPYKRISRTAKIARCSKALVQ